MRTIRFRMSNNVWALLGLDDIGLVASACPSLKVVGHSTPCVYWYEATVDDARFILDDMGERALDCAGGFDHTPAERRALRRAADHLRSVLNV